MKSILDKDFRYTSAAATNLEKTFARIRREQKLEQEARAKNAQEAARVLAKKGIRT